MRLASAAFVLLWLCSLAYAQGWEIPRGAAGEKTPLAPTRAVVDEGKRLYDLHCAKCHGPKGKGDGPDKISRIGLPI